MFLLRVLPSWSSWKTFCKVLLKAGAKATLADYEGISPFAKLIIDDRWDDATYVAKRGIRAHRLPEHTQEKVKQAFIRRALSALVGVDRTPSAMGSLLDDIHALTPTLGHALVSDILNQPLRKGPSLFVRMIEAELPVGILRRAVGAGASFFTSHRYTLGDAGVPDAAPFHAAVLTGNPRLIEFALKHTGGWNINQPVGAQGSGPLHLLYAQKSPVNMEAAQVLLRYGADPYARTATGLSLFDMAVAYRDIPGMELWAEYLVNPFAKASPLVQQIGLQDPVLREEKAKLMAFGKMRASLPRDVESDMRAYAGDEREEGFAERAKEFVEAYMVATSPKVWEKSNPELFKILPRMMLGKSAATMLRLVRAIDHLYDVDQSVRGYHPFEAELMTLLAHPGLGDAESKRELGKATVLALTSINRFINIHINSIPAPVRQMWARIGVLSFSFRHWKWDTHGIKIGSNRVLSLFEQYGFAPIVSDTSAGPDFGPGYVLSEERKLAIARNVDGRATGVLFNPQVRIEFRRGMLLASHRDVGTLVIRNSSPIFGRDILQHAAYYSRFAEGNGLTGADLKVMNPRIVEESFQRVLDAHLYASPQPMSPEIELLTSHLEAVVRDYESWKFRTDRETAWESIEGIGSFMTGGYFSEGYGAVVGYLKHAIASARAQGSVAPELAFFKRGFPAWSPARFKDDDSREHSTLVLTPRTVQLLEKMMTSSATRDDYTEDRGRTFQFFQNGFEMEGTLVIVDGKGSGDEYKV
jgi:hypothetical protein